MMEIGRDFEFSNCTITQDNSSLDEERANFSRLEQCSPVPIVCVRNASPKPVEEDLCERTNNNSLDGEAKNSILKIQPNNRRLSVSYNLLLTPQEFKLSTLSSNKNASSFDLSVNKFLHLLLLVSLIASSYHGCNILLVSAQQTSSSDSRLASSSEPNPQSATSTSAASCFGGLQTFEKISMSTFEHPSTGSSGSSFGSGILIQQDDQALTSECVNLCRSQSNCLSFVIDYNKFECKSYATTQQELQQEFDAKYQAARSVSNNRSNSSNATDANGYQASTVHFQHLLPSASSNYFEKICLDGVANRNQFSDVCSQGRLWTIERVVDTFLDGYVEKEVTNVNNKDECSKLCIFETQFVCRSADYDQQSRLCRLSKEDRRTQPQAMRHVPGSNRQYLENQCATPGPSSCVYETKKNVAIISMDALKFAQTVQDCQMKCNQESTFNCRSYSFNQQRCFLSGDDGFSLNGNLIKLPVKQGWNFGEKKCLVELCTKGIFSYEKITGYTLRSALSTPIDLMMPGSSSLSMSILPNDLDDLEKLQHESSQTRLRHLLPVFHSRLHNDTASMVSTMMMMAANSNNRDILQESESSTRHHRSASNLAITNHCRHSCDLGHLNCPAFTIDYKNNRCQRLDRNSQGRHHELVAQEGFAYYEKICLRVPEIMSMCQDKYWIFERVIGYELAPRLYDKTLKFVQSRRDCEEYCLEERQFQCRSALYNDEISECKLSRFDRRLAVQEGGYYRNFNVRISYLENQCIRDHSAEQRQQCYYEQAKEEPSYPTFTEHIEMVQPSASPASSLEIESTRQPAMNSTMSPRYGASYCEQLCNDNARFECHSFGYYASAAQCFLSGDDSISAGESATSQSAGFTYFEKKCRLAPATSTNYTTVDEPNSSTTPTGATTTTSDPQGINPYLQPPQQSTVPANVSSVTDTGSSDPYAPPTPNRNSNFNGDSYHSSSQPKQRPSTEIGNETSGDPDQYKCGAGHTFVYQRISGFEPIGGFLTLLVKNNDHPGIVAECSELCKKAFECRAFVVDYNKNQCFAMLENSSVGLLSLRQTLGKDYFEGFCVSEHILISTSGCKSKTWIIDKIVDQAVIGVQHQKIIPDADRAQCRQACLEERLFYCKSAMFDGATGECKLYSIDRESIPQMRLIFTKGVDFYENQCQITTNSCPYDAIERDMTIVVATKSMQARSTFDCEHACNSEITFNCRSYTYLDQYPSLPNLCLLSSDSRSTSQKGSVLERQRTLYAERNCYYRRPRYPGGSNQRLDPLHSHIQSIGQSDPYQIPTGLRPSSGHSSIDGYGPPMVSPISELSNPGVPSQETIGPALAQGCEPHQYTFERLFGYDFRSAQRERAPIAPTIGIVIGCQQECLRRGDRCQSFVVEYALPYQSCFLIESQAGLNKKLLVKTQNSAYFEKVCLPRTGIETETLTHVPMVNGGNPLDSQSMDIAPSYSNEPWSPQVPDQLPYYLRQQQLIQNYPSRSCSKLWSFERFVNHNFTAPSDKVLDDILSRTQCETNCLNEAHFSCRAATYDYSTKICRLFKNTRRMIMSQFIDLEMPAKNQPAPQAPMTSVSNSQLDAAQMPGGADSMQTAQSNSVRTESERRQAGSRQLSARMTAEASVAARDIDYMENTCVPEPSSCQYRQLYDLFSPYIDKISHAVSLSDCQRQCDLERLFSCKSVNYDPSSRNCMLINEDLISLDRDQQSSLLPKRNTIYSEKGNCELMSVQCNSQEMLVSINFDAPFRGRIMAKGNPEQCFLIGDGQTNIQFPIVFGPKCNSRQEGHNTFVNEVVIQQHPVIMTDSDKTTRVMCAFEAPDQTITLKSPTSRDNKTGIDVGAPDSSRTRHDKQQFNSVVSNKASPPSVLLRILDKNGRDASMINLGDDLVLRIQMQTEGQQNSALGIFARNLAAQSSNGETLLLIDNDGCPVDDQVFPALEVDPRDGKSLYSTFKAFRFPSSGLVNFEVQIKFCPERCQPVDCHKGQKMRSYGRKKREAVDGALLTDRTPILQSVEPIPEQKNPIEALSTVMKPGKAFQYVRELLLAQQSSRDPVSSNSGFTQTANDRPESVGTETSETDPQTQGSLPSNSSPDYSSLDNLDLKREVEQPMNEPEPSKYLPNDEFSVHSSSNTEVLGKPDRATDVQTVHSSGDSNLQSSYQKSILMHVDEKIVPSTSFINSRGLNQQHNLAPYGRFPLPGIDDHNNRQENLLGFQTSIPESNDDSKEASAMDQKSNVQSDNSAHQDRNQAETLASFDLTPGADTNRPNGPFQNDGTSSSHQGAHSPENANARDVPLRFSILVGENQAQSSGWTPGGAPIVMNSSTVDLDHIVIPGKNGQFETTSPPGLSRNQPVSSTKLPQNPVNPYTEAGYQAFGDIRTGNSHEQTFDALPSNYVAAEVKINQPIAASSEGSSSSSLNKHPVQSSETAASHDCQIEAGNSRLKTIIWTGTFVIVLNVCLVVLSLVLYFKKVHLRQNHNIIRATSDCGTHSTNSRYRWPSVLLKSKSNLGTSLNTHEHFFCKLNSKPGAPTRTNGHDFNWPNLSSSSSHSTISSMASPLPVTSIRINQTRPLKAAFDNPSSIRNNFNTGHKSVLEANSFADNESSLHATYTNNIDDIQDDTFKSIH